MTQNWSSQHAVRIKLGMPVLQQRRVYLLLNVTTLCTVCPNCTETPAVTCNTSCVANPSLDRPQVVHQLR